MAPKGNPASWTNRRITRNFGGRKNNKLVTCALCIKKVHIRSNCSTTYVPPNNDSCTDEAVERQVDFFKPVTVNDVILAVVHFKSQGRGEDGIPLSIVAKGLPTVTPHLTKLFSVSLARGVFPSSWKKARLIALKKVSTPSSSSEFRPIALLCFLSKVLEKLTHDQIVTYLKIAKIFDHFQVSFKKHHCTQSALLKLTNDILMGMGKKDNRHILAMTV